MQIEAASVHATTGPPRLSLQLPPREEFNLSDDGEPPTTPVVVHQMTEEEYQSFLTEVEHNIYEDEEDIMDVASNNGDMEHISSAQQDDTPSGVSSPRGQDRHPSAAEVVHRTSPAAPQPDTTSREWADFNRPLSSLSTYIANAELRTFLERYVFFNYTMGDNIAMNDIYDMNEYCTWNASLQLPRWIHLSSLKHNPIHVGNREKLNCIMLFTLVRSMN